MSENTKTYGPDVLRRLAEDDEDGLALLPNWDKLISRKLETANRFSGCTLVMSETAVRYVVLETLKMHGISSE